MRSNEDYLLQYNSFIKPLELNDNNDIMLIVYFVGGIIGSMALVCILVTIYKYKCQRDI